MPASIQTYEAPNTSLWLWNPSTERSVLAEWYLWVSEPCGVGVQVERDATEGSGEGYSSDEQHRCHGKCGGEVACTWRRTCWNQTDRVLLWKWGIIRKGPADADIEHEASTAAAHIYSVKSARVYGLVSTWGHPALTRSHFVSTSCSHSNRPHSTPANLQHSDELCLAPPFASLSDSWADRVLREMAQSDEWPCHAAEVSLWHRSLTFMDPGTSRRRHRLQYVDHKGDVLMQSSCEWKAGSQYVATSKTHVTRSHSGNYMIGGNYTIVSENLNSWFRQICLL